MRSQELDVFWTPREKDVNVEYGEDQGQGKYTITIAQIAHVDLMRGVLWKKRNTSRDERPTYIHIKKM
jgi:hypothetical protein